MARRLLLGLGAVVVGAGLLWAAASRDTCGSWPDRQPSLAFLARGQGPLLVGAGSAPLELPWPVPVAGYGPPRPMAERAATPLKARALTFSVGGQRRGLVLLDLLFITPQLRDAIARDQPAGVIVVATHTHSGPGAYATNRAAEWAALGFHSPGVEAALATAGRAALAAAFSDERPVRFEYAQAQTAGVTVPRSGETADQRLSTLRFVDDAGRARAQLLVASAHPALVDKKTTQLHADWPGLLAETLERDGGPLTLVLQGAVGNARVDRHLLPTPEAVAARLAELARAQTLAPHPAELDAAWSELHVPLPRPDLHRLAPPGLRAIGENALCDDAEDLAVLHLLRLGDVSLLFTPFEPSWEAGRLLEEVSGADRVISLADGYHGYVETMAVAAGAGGESRRQYFPPELIKRLAEGARLAGETTRPLTR